MGRESDTAGAEACSSPEGSLGSDSGGLRAARCKEKQACGVWQG